MRKKITIILLIIFIIIMLLVFLKNKNPEKLRGKNIITVSILPERYFVKRIVGEDYKINVMLPPGASPTSYDPTPRQLKELNKSKIYFRIGYIPFEKNYMKKIANLNSEMKIIDISEGTDLIKKGKSIDPHIWLSPNMVKLEAENIMKAMIKLNPKETKKYQENYLDFKKDLDILDKKIKEKLENKQNNKFLVYHPSWSYFARDYKLNQIPIEVDGKNPTPKNVKKIIDLAKKENIKIIVVQKQMSIQSAKTIAREINGEVIQLDPLSENWYENMEKILTVFEEKIIKK
ncbi:MAG: hypothetical protein B6I28_02540 [Fusobacteriia bacterium 4572_132]|nr:MAG: hypothetical protein B6I28_02540 [Fusobacteriia bacterium 4572_132]